MEFEQLCKRFEIAVANFGRSCIDLRANEKAFQAWYAASVIQEFGMSRVYREVHCNASYLRELLFEHKLLAKFKMKNEIFPDLSISWASNIDARHTSTRIANLEKHDENPQKDKILQKFAIVSELKVTGSTANATTPRAIKRDFVKLTLLADAQRKEVGSGASNDGGFSAYSVILDNHFSVSRRLDHNESESQIAKILFKAKEEWPEDSIKPKVIVIQPAKTGVNIQIYDQFKLVQQ
jgi:hypothetical protein